MITAVFSALACAVLVAQDAGALEKARMYASSGRVQAAIDAYEAWLRAEPMDRAVLREAATFAFRERRWFETARWLDRYVAIDPGDPSGWFDLGAVRHNQCRFDLAIAAFRQVEALEASDPRVLARGEHRFLHGESARKLERFGEAIPELEIAAARLPDRVDYRTAFAQALYDGGRFDAAASEFAKLARLTPTAEVYYGLGCALAESGRVDEAIAALKEARRLRAGDARTLARLGTLAMRTKDLRRAESWLIEAREAAPKNADVHFALAQVQRLSGQTEEAEASRATAEKARREIDAATERARVFYRALVTHPENAEAHQRHALDLLSQARFDEAQTILLRLLSFDPRNDLAIVNLATLLARQGEIAAAQKELRKILDVDPTHEVANIHAARIQLMLKDPSAALEHVNAAIARNPRSAEAHEVAILASRAAGDGEGAARYEELLRSLRASDSRPPR